MATPPLRRDALRNRVALLDAARSLLARDPAASLEAIAAEAGLSRRAVYGHFSDRSALLHELIAWRATAVTREVAALHVADPLYRIALVASRLWSRAEDYRILTLVATTVQASDGIAWLRPLRDLVLEAVREGQRDGRVRTDGQAERIARLGEAAVFAAVDEAVHEGLDPRDGRRLAVISVLAVAGLEWRAAGAFLDAHPGLLDAPGGEELSAEAFLLGDLERTVTPTVTPAETPAETEGATGRTAAP